MATTKADLVDGLHDRLGIPKKQAIDLVELVFDTVKNELTTSDKVKISGFGNFFVREKNSRMGRNPQTGAQIEIQARRVLTFKPSQVLRDVVNEALKDHPVDPDRVAGRKRDEESDDDE